MQRGEPVVVFIHFLMEQQISAPSRSARCLSSANSHHDISSFDGEDAARLFVPVELPSNRMTVPFSWTLDSR
jgi:hypothetical protein